MKIMKKFLFIILIILIFGSSNRIIAKTELILFGKGNFVRSAGSKSDYIEGKNDFPIMSAHQTYGFGFGLTSYTNEIFFMGIEVHYNLKGKAVLTDPSDNDTVEIDTYKNLSGFLTLGFNLIRSDFLRFFMVGGGGVYYPLNATRKTYISKLGYETIIEPFENKYHLSGFGGIGITLSFSESIGFILCGRYTYIAIKEQPETMIEAITGLFFRF